MEPSIPQGFPPSLHGIPFDKKWDLLRPDIERLYVNEGQSLSDVIRAIKDKHGFDAAESQYKYQIKKWKLKKNISTSTKGALCQVIQKRANLGKSSAITRRGQELDTKNLRRYLKTKNRRAMTLQPATGGMIGDTSSFSGRITLSGNRIFMNWNMPYEAMKLSAVRAVNHASPLSDIVVTTPPSTRGLSSPMALAVKEMTAIQRTRLFVQGRQMDLLKSLEKSQRIIMSTWMYQYWLFTFTTAKYWGRGPHNWTAGNLGFDAYRQQTTIPISLPGTPGVSIGTPVSQPTSREDEMLDSAPPIAVKMPSPLCRWRIHCNEVEYDEISSPSLSATENFDLNDQETWPTWPGSHDSREFIEKISNSLESNDFSSIKPDELPIAVDQVAKAARSSPEELLKETLGFSIMSRNIDLMQALLEEIGDRLDDSGLYPFHLAVSYLDGSKTCCDILFYLVNWGPRSLRKLHVNDLGHTVLDQIMIAILKAHTSCLPSAVDDIFHKEKRFEGEDVDICGRWDADSDCVRTLLATGNPRIPFEWKHMFCHTSIQTITHCLELVLNYSYFKLDKPSGLFVRRCSHCGLKLQLLPLHTLDKANISVQALLGNEEADQCSHEELDPAELMEKVPASVSLRWSRELTTGWQLILHILRHSQAERKAGTSGRQSTSSESEHEKVDTDMYSEDKMSTDKEPSHIPACLYECQDDRNFGKSKVLGPLWAATQTEILTYRRLGEGDPWISQNFDMHALEEGLTSEGKADVALVQKDMMKPFCSCGQFLDVYPDNPPCVTEAAAYYFSNMEDWDRTTFLPRIYV